MQSCLMMFKSQGCVFPSHKQGAQRLHKSNLMRVKLQSKPTQSPLWEAIIISDSCWIQLRSDVRVSPVSCRSLGLTQLLCCQPRWHKEVRVLTRLLLRKRPSSLLTTRGRSSFLNMHRQFSDQEGVMVPFALSILTERGTYWLFNGPSVDDVSTNQINLYFCHTLYTENVIQNVLLNKAPSLMRAVALWL